MVGKECKECMLQPKTSNAIDVLTAFSRFTHSIEGQFHCQKESTVKALSDPRRAYLISNLMNGMLNKDGDFISNP